MKKIVSIFLIIGLIITPILMLSGCGSKEQFGADYEAGTPTSYITLNINPAVEIVADDKNKVIAINGINDEGTMLFFNKDYRGYNIDVVIREMVKVMAQTGYITALEESGEEAVFVSVLSTTSAKKNEIFSLISVTVNEFFRASGLYSMVVETKFSSKIHDYAVANNVKTDNVVDDSKFRAILKAMEYDIDLELADALDLTPSKLIDALYKSIKKIGTIETKEQKDAYLNDWYTKQQELEADIAYNVLSNNAGNVDLQDKYSQYIALYEELEDLEEQYQTADYSLLSGIKTNIEEVTDDMAPLYTSLKTAHRNAIDTKTAQYRNQITTLFNEKMALADLNPVSFSSMISEREQTYLQNFQTRTQYVTVNKNVWNVEYEAWRLNSGKEQTFLERIATDINDVKTQTRNEVSRALNRVNPYSKSFGFGDSGGSTWTFP